ncbi:MAG: GH1 family beta-glucosidase [Promethearchaeota archaeon]|jgi:beta-glucosidase
MTKIEFPKDFLWGTATASYQIEGAWNKDFKGESVWDMVSHTPGKIRNGDTGDIACDHYHRYKEDIQIMKQLNLNAYRFSISWPRIFPLGKGNINEKGVEFYDNLINELIANGIEPVVTLYHWDLPLALQNIGSWENREVVDAYVAYTKFVFNHYGDRVKKWITFNEPAIFTIAFFGGGVFTGNKDLRGGYIASTNVNVAHAKAVRAYRNSIHPDGEIGITLNLSHVYTRKESALNSQATHFIDGITNRWYLDPILKGHYPEDILSFLDTKFNFPSIPEEDLVLLKENPIDYLGINNYNCTWVAAERPEDLTSVRKLISVGRVEGREYSKYGWEVCPEGFHDLLVRIDKDYNHPIIYITENGYAGEDDKIVNGIVQDDDRLNYLKRYFKAAHDAMTEGVKLKGYFIWSLLDNFEWLAGFSIRFGLIRVNFETQERIWKKSAQWYRDLIAQNGFNLD